MKTTHHKQTKHYYMSVALALAKKALSSGEVPIGAVVVNKEGIVIGKGYNRVEKMQSQLAHAEIQAIKQAQKKTGDWRLNGCVIYVSLEPCLMCLGLIMLSRLDGIVYAADSPLYGCGLSTDNKNLQLDVKHLNIEHGVSAREGVALLQTFFKNVRKKKKGLS